MQLVYDRSTVIFTCYLLKRDGGELEYGSWFQEEDNPWGRFRYYIARLRRCQQETKPAASPKTGGSATVVHSLS